MPKKKKRLNIKRGNWRKFAPFTILLSAVIVGVIFLPTKLLNQNTNQSTKKAPPKIDSVSPTTITVGKEFTISGSGFTTTAESKGPQRAGGIIATSPGNWYQIKGGVHGPPALSSDGKTLTFRLSLDTRDLPKNCLPGATGKKCQVPLQVINGYGVPSNAKQIEFFIPEHKTLLWSSGIAPDSPTTVNITPGASNVEVLKIKVKADAQNSANIQVDGLAFALIGPNNNNYNNFQIDCYQTLDGIGVFDVASGQVLGGDSVFAGGLTSGCFDYLSLYPALILPPGTEKTISILLSLKPTAQVGLQFRVQSAPIVELVFQEGYEGYQGYTEVEGYPGPQGSDPTITIVAP